LHGALAQSVQSEIFVVVRKMFSILLGEGRAEETTVGQAQNHAVKGDISLTLTSPPTMSC